MRISFNERKLVISRRFRFHKTAGQWFIDLKYWPASVAHLAMVAGADELLDILAKGNDSVWCEISTQRPKQYDDVIRRLTVLPKIFNGAVYKPTIYYLQDNGFGKNKLWLCGVTLFVFLRYPKKIYFNVVSEPSEDKLQKSVERINRQFNELMSDAKLSS